MELKYHLMNLDSQTTSSSNRTFMELKYGFDISKQVLLSSSNRTFMELKYCKWHQHLDQLPKF